MKRMIFLLLPFYAFAIDLPSLLQAVSDGEAMKSAKLSATAAKQYEKVAEASKYPTLNASYTAAKLNDYPTMKTPMGAFMAGEKQNYTGSVMLSYPVFTGFAIDAAVERSKAAALKASLSAEDLRRNLYMQTVELYCGCYAAKMSVEAFKSSLKAAEDALKRAEGFYKEGLVAAADLANLRAKKFEMKSQLIDAEASERSIFNSLGYLSTKTVDSIEGLPKHTELDTVALQTNAKEQREDVKALKSSLDESDAEIKAAAADDYPKLSFVAELKHSGEKAALEKNNFSNVDKSYAALSLSYTIFDGFATRYSKEAAKVKKLSVSSYLSDYQNKVASEVKSSALMFEASKFKLTAAKQNLDAADEYYKLTQGRYDNHLSSADELSRAISGVAAAKALVAKAEADIYSNYAKTLLSSSLELFEKKLGTRQ